MRIIGGTAAGRLLKVPKGYTVRPTPDLVKQAVFNSLGGRVFGARVLELFAGSGALGLECLSRGARSVLAIEKSRKHANLVARNLRHAGLSEASYGLRVQDVFVAVSRVRAAGERFDLILADPPFGEKNVGRRSTSDSQRLLDDEDLPALLADGGRFILGHARRDELTLTGSWDEKKVLRHGDSVMRFLGLASGE